MNITEKMLLDGFVGVTFGLNIISRINGIPVRWVYRTGSKGERYTSVCDRVNASQITGFTGCWACFATVFDLENASEITLRCERLDTIPSRENDTHPACALIQSRMNGEPHD